MSFIGKYDTKLSPADEEKFLRWAQGVGRVGDTADYDLRGAWQSGAQEAANGHLPDTYKKPNHPTFSNESRYSSPERAGGEWVESPTGGWGFWASPLNMDNLGAAGLSDYFSRVEPDATLVLPIDYRLKGR